MVEEEKIKEEIITLCASPFPRTPVSIIRKLKDVEPNFYRNSPPPQVVSKLRKKFLTPLKRKRILIEFKDEDDCWGKAKQLCNYRARKNSEPVPRKVSALYQTHFLLSGDEKNFIFSHLVKPTKELNLDMRGFLHRFEKPEDYHQNMINLLLASSERFTELTTFLHQLPIDYKEVNILEKVLEHGSRYKGLDLPFSPDFENAKYFLRELTNSNTGT